MDQHQSNTVLNKTPQLLGIRQLPLDTFRNKLKLT